MFPPVPIDESHFNSNVMMNEYWERSTKNREFDEDDDIRRDTLAAFAEQEPEQEQKPEQKPVAPVVLPVRQVRGVPDARGPIVVPKSLTGWQTFWIIFLSIVGISFVATLYKYKRL